MRRLTLLAALLCVMPVTVRAASPKQHLPSQVLSAAAQQLYAKTAGAISVTIVNDGKIVAYGTMGAADQDTAFSVGSVSKMFTAVSIMLLAQDDKVNLNESAAQYLPQYPALRAITVKELLDHTSGLPNYLDDALATGSTREGTTPAQILSSSLARPLDFTPGTDWNYTNTGYVALGQIVERVSGLSLAEFEKQHVFRPLGMDHTYAATRLGSDVAAPANGDPGDWSWYYGCGDVFSTATDLAKFDIALMDGRILSPALFRAMQTTVPFTTLAPGMKDGLGLFVTQVGNLRLVGHHGGEPGFRADNEMVPFAGFAVAIVGSGNYNTNGILAAVLRAYFPKRDWDAPLPPGAYVDGAPAVTARMAKFLDGLSAGNEDLSHMDVLARIAVPPLMHLMQNHRLERLRFISKTYTDVGILYEYRALLAKQDAIFTVVIDGKGTITQIGMVPLPSPENAAP